jgi:hypothetical protein
MAQRAAAARAVEDVERRELRALTDQEALRLADALLAAVPIEEASRQRREHSGLVEQQRLFARARR